MEKRKSNEDVALSTKMKFLVFILFFLLVLFLNSCQYLTDAAQEKSQIQLLSDLLLTYSKRLDSMTDQIAFLEKELTQTQKSSENLQKIIDKNYLLLLTLSSSITYMDYLQNSPNLSSASNVPDMETIEKMIREQIALQWQRFEDATPAISTVSEDQMLVPKTLLTVLELEINKLKMDYRQLRWQSYNEGRLPTDPFSLDDLSLVLGGKIQYTIQSGDTLSQIAQAFGLGVDGVKTLVDENKISDPKMIKSGEALSIPLPPLQERIMVPLAGKNRLIPEDIKTFFGESVDSGISRGLTFNIVNDQTIVSCMPGRVIDQGAAFVVVYHGNGLKAIYNDLSQTYVKKGDWVMSGQALGVSMGKEFRLEILINIEYRDPMLLFLQNMGSFQVTFYTEWDDGNLPFFPYFRRTKEGSFAREWYTVAADPKLIPPGTMVYVPEFRSSPSRGLFVVEDIGSAIQSKKLDVYIRDIREASKMKLPAVVYRFGH